jgi:hypothetical protein
VSLLQELELEPILESIVDSGSRQLRAEKAVLKGKKDVVRAEDVLAQLDSQPLRKAAGEPMDTGPTIAATQVLLVQCVEQHCCVLRCRYCVSTVHTAGKRAHAAPLRHTTNLLCVG